MKIVVSGTSCFGIFIQTQALEPGGGVTVITLREKEEKNLWTRKRAELNIFKKCRAYVVSARASRHRVPPPGSADCR